MARIGTALAIAATLFLAPAYAANESFLKDAPASRLSESELRAFWAFIGKTLDETPDGTTVEWKATKATFSSKVTPQRSFEDGALKCREATVDSDSHDRQMRGLYQFCKTSKGWQFKTPSRKPQAGK